MALEVSPLSDVWSLGLVVVELYTGVHVYQEYSDRLSASRSDVDEHYAIFKEFRHRVVTGEVPKPPPSVKVKRKEGIPVRAFLEECLQKVPEGRSFPRTLLDHDYIRAHQDVAEKELILWSRGHYSPPTVALGAPTTVKDEEKSGRRRGGADNVESAEGAAMMGGASESADPQAMRETMRLSVLALGREERSALRAAFRLMATEEGIPAWEAVGGGGAVEGEEEREEGGRGGGTRCHRLPRRNLEIFSGFRCFHLSAFHHTMPRLYRSSTLDPTPQTLIPSYHKP